MTDAERRRVEELEERVLQLEQTRDAAFELAAVYPMGKILLRLLKARKVNQ
jgi:hypothetical protein